MKVLLFLSVLIALTFCLPELPKHSFETRVLLNHKKDDESVNVTSKKVFVTFKQGSFSFKKKRVKANRVTFTCNGCEKFKHYLPVMAWRDVVDSDEENDIYILDGETLPSVNEHVCGTHGMKEMVRCFWKKMEEEIRADPTQPFPTLYIVTRYV